MFTIDSSLAAEIDYRTNRVRQGWTTRRRGIWSTSPRTKSAPRRRVFGGVVAAR